MTVHQQGFLRLPIILTEYIPVSKSTWWNGVSIGVYPPAVRLSSRTTAWNASDITELCQLLSDGKDWRNHQQVDMKVRR